MKRKKNTTNTYQSKVVLSPEKAEAYRRLEESEKHYRPMLAWTEEDDAILRRFYGKVPVHKLAHELHRSKSAVVDRANTIGISKSHATQSRVVEK